MIKESHAFLAVCLIAIVTFVSMPIMFKMGTYQDLIDMRILKQRISATEHIVDNWLVNADKRLSSTEVTLRKVEDYLIMATDYFEVMFPTEQPVSPLY